MWGCVVLDMAPDVTQKSPCGLALQGHFLENQYMLGMSVSCSCCVELTSLSHSHYLCGIIV